MKQRIWLRFVQGLVVGVLVAAFLWLILLYTLSVTDVIAVSVPSVPDFYIILNWTYKNLRLSVIPFTFCLLLYGYSLARLKHRLNTHGAAPQDIAQLEHMVDIWINLFFGIGVIWTAIGIRSALLASVGELDPVRAAELGAFTILQRLVDGGIILALSTTIVGGIGGYLLRIFKAMTVGANLQAYYAKFSMDQTEEIRRTLYSIDDRLAKLARSQDDPSGEPI